eukprot:473436-Pleurochrysis_carterae.AAC.1
MSMWIDASSARSSLLTLPLVRTPDWSQEGETRSTRMRRDEIDTHASDAHEHARAPATPAKLRTHTHSLNSRREKD